MGVKPMMTETESFDEVEKGLQELNMSEDHRCYSKGIHVDSLQDLIQKLHVEFEKDEIDVDYVNEIMQAYKSKPSEWKKYAKFDRFRYTRNLVDSGNDKFNLMILCWGEGHGSAIHDHADAHCFMKILQGSLSEVRFAWPKNSTEESNADVRSPETENCLTEIGRTEIRTNDICYINDSLGLHRVENPSHADQAVSLHLYCPPFDTCSVFNQHTGQQSKCKVTFWSKYGEKRNKVIQEGRSPEDN